MKVVSKKDLKTKNVYHSAGGVWVRDFTDSNLLPMDINNLIPRSEFGLLINNESQNKTLNLSRLEDKAYHWRKIVIVSDGFAFDKIHKGIAGFPSDVKVLAVNGALDGWRLMTETVRRPINFYVINNPYKESLYFIPRKGRYFPSCVASTRTNHDFVRSYPGKVFTYNPSLTKYFGAQTRHGLHLDDYRNPICAAISLAQNFGAEKIMFMCCDDCFDDERPGSIKVGDGLWMYPQHKLPHQIISSMIVHLSNFGVKLSQYGNGPEYANVDYIEDDAGAKSFFSDED